MGTAMTWETKGDLKFIGILSLPFVVLFLLSLLCSGCAGMRTYSSNVERCPDGCWTETQTPFGLSWCRLENGEKICHPER